MKIRHVLTEKSETSLRWTQSVSCELVDLINYTLEKFVTWLQWKYIWFETRNFLKGMFAFFHSLFCFFFIKRRDAHRETNICTCNTNWSVPILKTYSVACANGMPMNDGLNVSVYISMPEPRKYSFVQICMSGD